ncbi:hypothetical protein L226DRAFT_143849 [Lentinus tigrinus ALCF2SS1-7]|uniref:Uncharacterized protein n=1 Tax=Lentinus tigrinus ALCF2SS1-6 TaxID=1328759 RepID=A0A5C2RQ75_9APHY|nr:hypothetical protein L227DRAFT_403424 [Lentinus tigrinus ALCF2SS1-6]RPD72672.1 hypothetical protein L226DRAFT_143849 [Lentinus tigrinus ALCF2SS1-7]
MSPLALDARPPSITDMTVKSPADDEVYQVGYIFETLETVDAVVKAIFRRVTWEVHPQKPTPQPPHRYVDTHSNSSSPSLNALSNPRPCVVMQRALKNEAGSLLVICLMATFWGTVDVALLPSVLCFFVVAVWPHIAISKGHIHFHTTPDWPANRNTWLIAYRHNTTSYRTIARWSYHKDTRYSYIYDTHTCPPRKAAHSPRTPSSHSEASSISLTPGLANLRRPRRALLGVSQTCTLRWMPRRRHTSAGPTCIPCSRPRKGMPAPCTDTALVTSGAEDLVCTRLRAHPSTTCLLHRAPHTRTSGDLRATVHVHQAPRTALVLLVLSRMRTFPRSLRMAQALG